jgi:hypothetical protein
MVLEQIQTIQAGDFPELGTPSGIYHGRDGAITAIATVFGKLWWPARILYDGQRLLYRVSLYDARGDRLALYDDCRFPVNDIAIHPVLPIIAIATGRYDGGYAFEGALLIYYWEENTAFSVLNEIREVTHCRFSDDGDTLTILVHPITDADFDWDFEQASNTYYQCTLPTSSLTPAPPGNPQSLPSDPRLMGLPPVDPTILGFSRDRIERADLIISVTTWAASHGKTFEERHHVWDLVWLPHNRVAYLHSGCLIEVFDINSRESVQWPLPVTLTGNDSHVQNTQLHYTAASDELFVNVVAFGSRDVSKLMSLLYRTTLSGEVKECQQFNAPFAFSWDASDYCLGRNIEPQGDAQTAFLFREGKQPMPLGLGHYDGANHYLRLDGGKSLYFLQGTPSSSHQKKYLCSLDSESGKQTRLWPADTKNDHEHHMMHFDGCLVSDNAVVLTSVYYQPDPTLPVQGFITRHDLQTGCVQWQQSVGAQAAATAYCAVADVVICALVDGSLHLFKATTGEIQFADQMIVDGIPTIPLSLSVNDNRVAVGTMDSRVVIYRLCKPQ